MISLSHSQNLIKYLICVSLHELMHILDLILNTKERKLILFLYFQETKSWTHWSRPPSPEVESFPTFTSHSSERRERVFQHSRKIQNRRENISNCLCNTSQYNVQNSNYDDHIILVCFTCKIKHKTKFSKDIFIVTQILSIYLRMTS